MGLPPDANLMALAAEASAAGDCLLFAFSSQLSESSEKLKSPAPCTPVAPCRLLRFTADSPRATTDRHPLSLTPPSTTRGARSSCTRDLFFSSTARTCQWPPSRRTSASHSTGGPLDVPALRDEVEQWRAQHGDPFGLGEASTPHGNARAIELFRSLGLPLPSGVEDVARAVDARNADQAESSDVEKTESTNLTRDIS